MHQVRKTLPWALVVVAICAVVAGVLEGRPGVIGAAGGGLLVCLFFASSPAALGPITKVSPHLSLLVAMLFFLTKVIALLALFTVLHESADFAEHVHAKSLAGTVVVTSLAWTFFQVRAAKRQRIPIYDLPDKS